MDRRRRRRQLRGAGGEEPPPGPGETRRAITLFGRPATITGYTLDTTYFSREASNGVWFAGINGVSCLAGNDWFVFRTASGLPPAGGSTVAVDDDGFVWVGTPDNGLFRSVEPFDAERLRAQRDGVDVARRVFVNVWRKSSGAPSESMRSLLWHDHKLWAGTTEGLAVIETKPFRVVTIIKPAALGGPMVVGLAAAPDGAVWVSQNAGVVRDRSAHVPRHRERLEGRRPDRGRGVGVRAGRGRRRRPRLPGHARGRLDLQPRAAAPEQRAARCSASARSARARTAGAATTRSPSSSPR